MKKEIVKLYIITTKDKSYTHLIGDIAALPIKIGISNNVEQRLHNLQTGNFVPLTVLGTLTLLNRDKARELEKTLHILLEEYKSVGEWFLIPRKICPNIKEQLNNLIGKALLQLIVDRLPEEGVFAHRRRRHWEHVDFYKACEEIKPFINNEIFWALVNGEKVEVNNKTYPPFNVTMGPEKRLALASSLFQEYKIMHSD